MTVNFAIIPVAGWGTRMLPFTRAVPKELLPVYDKTVLDWAILEAVVCGIDNIILVSNERKQALHEHINIPSTIAEKVEESLETSLYRQVNIKFVNQHEQAGLGHAIYQAEQMVEGEDFAVILPDEIMLPQCTAPTEFQYDLSRMLQVFSSSQIMQLAVKQIARDDVSRYGIVELASDNQSIIGMQEKPSIEEAASDLALVGRYVCKNELMHILSQTPPGAGGEIQLTDALQSASNDFSIHAHVVKGIRTDVGNKESWLAAQSSFQEYFLKHNCDSEAFLAYGALAHRQAR